MMNDKLDKLLSYIGCPVEPEMVDRVMGKIYDGPSELGDLVLRGAIKGILEFLTEILRRRKELEHLNILLGKPSTPSYKAVEAVLRLIEFDDPGLTRLREEIRSLRDWTDDFIADQFLPKQYFVVFGEKRGRSVEGPMMRFVQAILAELKIERSADAIYKSIQRHWI
jgi:hypothetical protein